MQENFKLEDKQSNSVCADLLAASERQYNALGWNKVVTNFEFASELVKLRINGNSCGKEWLDKIQSLDYKNILETSKELSGIKDPRFRKQLHHLFPTSDDLLKQLDRNHNSKISEAEIKNRFVELEQINNSGNGDDKTFLTSNTLARLELFILLKNTLQKSAQNEREKEMTKLELDHLFYHQ